MPHRAHETTLIEVRGDLVLAALCVGQFRAPCQIEPDRLIVRASEPLVQALQALGLAFAVAEVESFTPAPIFAPEGQHARQVHTHISRHHDEEAPDEDDSRGSNA